MSYAFPGDIHERILVQLSSGAFESEDDVFGEALESLIRRQRGLAQLRDMVAVGEADAVDGRVGTFHRDEIKRDVRSRLAERGITD